MNKWFVVEVVSSTNDELFGDFHVAAPDSFTAARQVISDLTDKATMNDVLSVRELTDTTFMAEILRVFSVITVDEAGGEGAYESAMDNLAKLREVYDGLRYDVNTESKQEDTGDEKANESDG